MADAKVIKKRIENAIRRYARARSSGAYSLVPSSLTRSDLLARREPLQSDKRSHGSW